MKKVGIAILVLVLLLAGCTPSTPVTQSNEPLYFRGDIHIVRIAWSDNVTTPSNPDIPVAYLPILLPDGTTAYIPVYK